MKVKDLIERLKEHGEDKDVYILYDQFGRMEPDQMVRKRGLNGKRK